MQGRKRLAYGKGDGEEAGKPRLIRKLAFGLTVAATMSACSPATNAVAVRNPVLEEARLTQSQKSPPRHKSPDAAASRNPACSMSGRTLDYSSERGMVRIVNLLEAGETLAGIACRTERAFVLTDRSLFVVRPGGGSPDLVNDGVDISFVAAYSRTDMSGILSAGFVAWTQSDDAVFLLTRNGTLTLIPLENMGSTVPSYNIPYDVSGASMAYHQGYLFLATLSGQMVVIRGAQIRSIPFQASAGNPAFFVSGGNLVFGTKGAEETEIRMGEGIDRISLVRR
ncbi:hypothetical protein L0Y65_06835 [Candidatus Micrarchaeota archaeon]|nr:hypothetical protein [Candidatus Micrarchaeota archaeon]